MYCQCFVRPFARITGCYTLGSCAHIWPIVRQDEKSDDETLAIALCVNANTTADKIKPEEQW